MLTMLSHPEDINIERCQTPPTLGGMDVNTRLACQAVKRAESERIVHSTRFIEHQKNTITEPQNELVRND